MMHWLIVILTPILLFPVFGLSRIGPALCGSLLALAAAPALAAALGLFPDTGAEADALLLGASFGLDSTRRVFLLLTATLWAAAGAFAGRYLSSDPRRSRYAFFHLFTLAGNIGLIVAEDLAGFYTCFVLMTFAAYGLVVHSGTTEAMRAGRIYLIMAIFGELLLLPALYLAAAGAGSVQIGDVQAALPHLDNQGIILGLGLAGFGVKAGAVPLYFWLPLAHPVAPTPASAVLSGCMIKAGLLGWIHLSPIGAAALPGPGQLLIVLGLIAAFGAVALGLCQTDGKTILAYSSVSQMGLMTVLLGLALTAGEAAGAALDAIAYYAWVHGTSKGALFLGTSVIACAGLGRGWILAGLALPAATLAGAPFTAGASAKYALLEASVHVPGIWPGLLAFFLALSALATALLLGRFLWLCGRSAPTADEAPPPGLTLPWAALLLVVAVGSIGVRHELLPALPVPALSIGTLFAGSWPILLAALLIAGGARFIRRRHDRPLIPPGDFVVLIEKLENRIIRQSGRWLRVHPGRGAINLVPLIDRIIALEKTWLIVDRIEARLESWKVAGLAFLLALLVLVFFLQ